jgi:hypothetical protein
MTRALDRHYVIVLDTGGFLVTTERDDGGWCLPDVRSVAQVVTREAALAVLRLLGAEDFVDLSDLDSLSFAQLRPLEGA